MDIAIAKMTKPACVSSWKCMLDLSGSGHHELRHISNSDRNIMGERLAFGPFGFGNGIAKLPKSLRMGFVRGENGVPNHILIQGVSKTTFERL